MVGRPPPLGFHEPLVREAPLRVPSAPGTYVVQARWDDDVVQARWDDGVLPGMPKLTFKMYRLPPPMYQWLAAAAITGYAVLCAVREGLAR